MLLRDDAIKPGSAQVITEQHIVGPYVIKQVAPGRPDVGEAYQLVNEKTGKAL